MGARGGSVKTFALAAYPLSGAFRTELERESASSIEIIVLPELRRLGASALIRRLRSLEGRCLLPIEDPTSEVLLPILEALAAITRARTIEIVRANGSHERSSRLRSAGHAGALLAASADAQVALRRARREVDRLLHEPRADAALAGESILFLNANLWFGVKTGGSIAHVAGVANALVERGHELVLATASEPVGVTEAVTIRPLRPPRTYGLPPESNLYRFGRSVDVQLRDLPRPGFVYQRHSLGSYAGAVVARRAGVPLVLEYNGSEVWVARHWGRPLRYEGLALDAEEASLRHASLVVTISQALADELIERGVDPERVVWHSNGVDADRFDPARFSTEERLSLRDRYGIPHDAILVTFVGTFGQWHGVDVLARTIRREAEWARAAGVRFLLVGDGLKMPEVRAELEGLSDVAVLAGLVPQDDTPLHLAASDVLVSPHVPNADGSPFFGSPTKLFEYMAAAKAIVASDLDQIGDVLRDDLAVLVRPGDEIDLARGLRDAAADSERRTELGTRARARVLERHTWAHHVDSVLEALRRAGGP
jgi:glycosyltransferase involved in cell wall biosynthesis